MRWSLSRAHTCTLVQSGSVGTTLLHTGTHRFPGTRLYTHGIPKHQALHTCAHKIPGAPGFPWQVHTWDPKAPDFTLTCVHSRAPDFTHVSAHTGFQVSYTHCAHTGTRLHTCVHTQALGHQASHSRVHTDGIPGHQASHAHTRTHTHIRSGNPGSEPRQGRFSAAVAPCIGRVPGAMAGTGVRPCSPERGSPEPPALASVR